VVDDGSCCLGSTGAGSASNPPTWRTQTPAASTTTGAVIDRCWVSTPVTRPPATGMPMTGSLNHGHRAAGQGAVQGGAQAQRAGSDDHDVGVH
jgi:hypothetical protein